MVGKRCRLFLADETNVSLLLAILHRQSPHDNAFSLRDRTANVQDLHLESQIIPNLLSSLQAQALLNVAYSGNMISLGQALDQSAVQTQPNMTVSPESNATSTFGSDATFTVALVDADVVGTDDVANNVTRHWLVNNVKLSGGEAPYALDYTTAAM